jgi:hypothetical protein
MNVNTHESNTIDLLNKPHQASKKPWWLKGAYAETGRKNKQIFNNENNKNRT